MGVELKSLCTGRPGPSPPSFPQHFTSIFRRLLSSSEHRSCPSQALPFAAITCEAEPRAERSEGARLVTQAGRMQSAWDSPRPSQALWVSEARHLWRGTLQARYLEDSKSCFKSKEHKNFLGRPGVRRFGIWGEIVQRSFFLLHSHLPKRNPIATRCPLEPLRLGIAPLARPSHLWKHLFAASADKPPPAPNFVLGASEATPKDRRRGQNGSPAEMSTSASLLKRPLPTQKPPRPGGRWSPRSIAPKGALRTCGIPAPGGQGPELFIPGPGTRAAAPRGP